MADTQASELGSFLRSRRTALAPEAVGIRVEGMRRTAGLRRAELAQLAGVSPGYYTRLEQGRAPHPSPSVLAALANALRLSADEREHLFALGGDVRLQPAEPGELSLGARRMLELLSEPTAAYVIDRYSDVLAWNAGAAALFGHLVEGSGRPNNVRYVFTDPEARQRFSDWNEIAADSVAHLRAATGRRPDDPTLRRLVADLHARSALFRELWADHELRHKVSGHKRLYHPLVGAFTLDYAVLAVPNVPGQRLVAYSAEPGTTAYDALVRLAAAAPRASTVAG
ncbi:helix-turn-helix transcriptional regulator [Nocardia nova]|uniref:helix-turn-helix transcriptional regulator n=2 Tax=Nocardia nova TaxID=37330 RepID=UPI001893592F|nr:helix-turn-helix transcriptional regulator [Nocardia nova]MBF6144984.1 helix-turn-helix domain-containing protein [Nocardia nova]